MTLSQQQRRLHYGWVIAGAGVLVLLSSIGLGRLAYAMLLPGMQAGLHLSYAKMGLVGTCNFAGYLAAMFLVPLVVHRCQPRATVVMGSLVVGGSLLMMSQSHSYPALLVCFTITGVGTGLANISVMALTAPWYYNDQRGKATGILLCGNGLGVMLAGLVVPQFNRVYGVNGWRAGWLTFGLIALVVACTSALLLRNHPREMDLEPLGTAPVATLEEPYLLPQQGNRGTLVRLSLLYMAFGITASIYSTFIVSSMIHEYGLNERTAGFYWSWLGLCSFFSGVGFGTLSDRIGRGPGMAAIFGVQTVAYLLAGLKLGPVGLIVSVVLFGFTIFGSPAVITAACGDYFGASMARGLSVATLIFAIGQTLGPVIAGWIAGPSGIFTRAYLIAAVVTAAAAVFALTLRKSDKKSSY
jgi:sugar phosphate permease